MVIKACCDRELPEIIKALTAYQVREPVHLRIISPHVENFNLNNKSFSQRVMMLRSFKNATVSILVDKKEMNKFLRRYGHKPEIITELEDAGVNVLTVRDLHAKIVFLEAGKEKALLIGSSNLSKTAMYKSHEAGIYMLNDDPKVFERIGRYISWLFSLAQPIME
jgi:phosphatidylserine/phosphatidylglycerophosphate/cardiolipin synthase-like enzyme